MKPRILISLLIALSILAFNIASANVFVIRGLERSKVHALHHLKISARANAAMNHSIDKGSPAQHLNITFNLVAICNTLKISSSTSPQSQNLNISLAHFAKEEPIYGSFKPPKLQLI